MLRPVLRRPGWIGDFQAFIMRGNVVDLAVGIIIGAAFTGIVQSLVRDVFNPVIGLLTGGVALSGRLGPSAPSIAAAKAAGAVTVNYGLFVNAVIQFLIVAFVVFWLVRSLQRFMRKQEDAPTVLPNSEVLLAEIRDLLRDHANIVGPAA